MPSIVTINASVSVAPAPILLQQTGAAISQGGTTLANGARSLITQPSDLTPLLSAPLTLASLVWSGGVVAATTSAAIPGLSPGDTFVTTVAGATPAAYNGLFLGTVTGTNTFTYSLAANPGAETVPGTYTPPGVGELTSMITSFFAQGTNRAVYVLELGAGDATAGPAALAAWIVTNPGVFYSYLVPRLWDGSAGLLSLIAAYEAPTAKTYFFVTTTTSTYTAYTATMKNVVAMVEAPGVPLTEFSLAAAYQVSLAYAPSSTNRMTQFAFAFLYGVTAYPTVGNSALLTTLKAANVNYVGTGAEGGLSNTILLWGNTLSGVDFSWWYSADWAQLTCDETAANIVINGSNNPLSPLYFNQNGIDTLQDGIIQVLSNAVSYGLAAGTVARAALTGPAFANQLAQGAYAGQDVVNAVPFTPYVASAPADYAIGRYGGISIVYIPQNGFKAIVFDINITNLLSQ